MTINIDESAGFCWGVVRTIDKVEEVLQNSPGKDVYVLGDIIHNPSEIRRLEQIGMKTVNHEGLAAINPDNSTIIIRAHGEPPKTYQNIKDLGLNLVDATCPLVTGLQKRVRKYYDTGWQVIIYGKKEHAEVIGLRGVCNDQCIVIRDTEDALQNVDFTKKSVLFSQTTMDKEYFYQIKEALENKISELKIEDADSPENSEFKAVDSLCKYVWGREEPLKEFCRTNDVIIFVAGRHSSNGKSLYHTCQKINEKTYFIEEFSELKKEWLTDIDTVGITGATSTPQWYLSLVKSEIEKIMT